MNRRTYLAGFALPAIGSAAIAFKNPTVLGLPNPHDQTFSPKTGPYIQTYDFTLTPNSKLHHFKNFSTVSFKPATTSVHIAGQISSGGDDCTNIDLKTLAYEAKSQTLTAEIFNDNTDDWSDNCTAVQSFRPYELSITFAKALPQSVDVRHINDPNKVMYRHSFTRT